MRLFCKRQDRVEVQTAAGEINFNPLLSSPLSGDYSLFYFSVGILHSSGFSLPLSDHIFSTLMPCEVLALSTFLTSFVKGPHDHSAPLLKILGAHFSVHLSSLLVAMHRCGLNFQVHSSLVSQPRNFLLCSHSISTPWPVSHLAPPDTAAPPKS